MATSTHIMAADNYYLLPTYDEILRYDEPNKIFGLKAITGGALGSEGRYTLDRSTIILVKKVCGEYARLREGDTSTRANGTLG